MDKPIASVTFTADLVSEGSWGERDLGEHESTMDLHLSTMQAFIEWDVPDLETTENIGLTFEWKGGAWVLLDYDGVHSLPKEAVDLIQAQGFVVPEDFE